MEMRGKKPAGQFLVSIDFSRKLDFIITLLRVGNVIAVLLPQVV